MSRCPVSDKSGRTAGRVQALRRVPAYLAAPSCNGVCVLVCTEFSEVRLRIRLARKERRQPLFDLMPPRDLVASL
jgi:hypothetical protein